MLRIKSFIKQKEDTKSPAKDLEEAPKVNKTLEVQESAIELRLNTQISVLKRLKGENKISDKDYDRRLV